MKNRVVNVVSYCSVNSIGSILQSYGLKYELNRLSFPSVILLPQSYFQKKKASIKIAIRNLILKIISFNKIEKSYSKSNNFIDNYLDINIIEDSIEYYIDDDYPNIFIAGSDQIWNPDYCFPFYFLDFVKKARKIAYAASMGNTTIPISNYETFCRLVNNFDSISVREQECKNVIKDFTDKSISVLIDPVFFISKEEWSKCAKPLNIDYKYILVSMIYWDKSLKNKIKNLKKETGLTVIAICNNISRVYANKKMYDVGPREYIWLIENAEYVISSSFHGVAFSIIFNKNFSPIIDPKLPSRIENILRVLSVKKISIESLHSERIDYSIVNQKIELEREKGEQYLKNNLMYE